jgi:16S rRNA (guanine966-N2)-methyltransferase
MIPAVGTPKTEIGTARKGAARHGGDRKAAVPGNRNSVRIIGGSWRGRRVVFPDVPGLRPTPDRVRETLFNWLQHSVAGTRCLDLFAGSGVLGLEALSRGAREVVFVEQAREAARNLQSQLLHFGATASAKILEMDAGQALRNAPQVFDIVFLDPPFGEGALSQYVALLDQGGWVQAGSFVYLESEKAAGPPHVPANWVLLKSKSAGEVGYYLARVNARTENQ